MAGASQKIRILVTSPFVDPEAIALLRADDAEVRELAHDLDAAEVERAIIDFDPHAILSRTYPIGAKAMAGAPSLRVISKHGAGVDNIDLVAARRHGIAVTNGAGVNAPAVAEHVFALILALGRNVVRHADAMRGGTWSRFDFTGTLLQGRTIGLVGFGHIARRVARLAAAFDMPVTACSPRLSADNAPDHVTAVADLDALIDSADIISLHCPATPGTRGLIGERQFAAMRRDAWLINTARGSVVDEPALIEALRSGQIAGAGIDCFAEEPTAPDNPLLRMPNVVVTPHCGGATRQSVRRSGLRAARNLLAALHGRPEDVRAFVVGGP